MSNPNTFLNNYVATIQQLINNIENLRTMNDQLTQDSTLVTRYFAQDPTKGPTPRSDIVATDVVNAENAITQLLFTFDSGNPAQKQALFKLLP